MSESSKKVLSLKQVRLASLKGHVVIVPANEPTTIPAALFLEAARQGCVDYNPQMIEAFKAAMAKAAAEEKTPAKSEPQKNAVDAMKIARDAVRQVLSAGSKEPDLLTKEGLPRLPAVRAAYDVMISEDHVETELKITTDLIGALFLDIQEEDAPAPVATVARYPSGVPAGDLEGEEVGGVEDALSRVTEQQE